MLIAIARVSEPLKSYHNLMAFVPFIEASSFAFPKASDLEAFAVETFEVQD